MTTMTTTLEETYPLTIDFTQSTEKMIEAGRYDWVHKQFKNIFPVSGEGTIECEVGIFYPQRGISSENAIELIKNDGHNQWEPAQVQHLLAFGASYPDELKKFPVVALGSIVKAYGVDYVPCIMLYRKLHLGWFIDGWRCYYRFLAVRRK